jgi:hypothetical protein
MDKWEWEEETNPIITPAEIGIELGLPQNRIYYWLNALRVPIVRNGKRISVLRAVYEDHRVAERIRERRERAKNIRGG